MNVGVPGRSLLPWVLALGCAGLALVGGPVVLLAALAALVVTVQGLRHPLFALCAFAVVAPVAPYAAVNLGIRFTLSEGLLALSWGGLLLRHLLDPTSLTWTRGPTEGWILKLIAWSLVSLGVTHFTVQYDGNDLANWLRWMLNLSFVVLVPCVARTPAQQRTLVHSLMAGFAAMLLLSLGMFIVSPDARSMIPVLTALRYAHPEAVQDIFSANYVRMASPWVHPNATGAILLLLVPVAAFHAFSQRGWRRGLATWVALAGSAGIVLSGSRGSLVSLGVLWVWLAWRKAPGAGRALWVGSLLAAIMLVAYPPAQARLGSLFSSKDASTEVRLEEYKSFPQAAARYPVGLGFKLDPTPGFDGLRGISNFWLNYWFKLGLPGMILIIWITRSWWREVRPPTDLSKLASAQALGLGCTCAILGALVSGFFDHTFSFTPVLQGFFWLILTLSLQQARAHRQTTPP